jgi:hypothetical protein
MQWQGDDGTCPETQVLPRWVRITPIMKKFATLKALLFGEGTPEGGKFHRSKIRLLPNCSR